MGATTKWPKEMRRRFLELVGSGPGSHIAETINREFKDIIAAHGFNITRGSIAGQATKHGVSLAGGPLAIATIEEKLATKEASPPETPPVTQRDIDNAPPWSLLRMLPRRRRQRLKRNCTIFELEERSCRWPNGPMRARAEVYCGAETELGLPYCPTHCREGGGGYKRTRVR